MRPDRSTACGPGSSLLGAAKASARSGTWSPPSGASDLLRLAAATPTLVAALYRLARHESGRPRPRPRSRRQLPLDGDRPAPEPALARALEQYLILTVDHGFNSSTFTARVIASTGADAAAAMVGAIGALSGPLHGGAPSRALDTIDAIGPPERAEPYIRAAVSRGDRIMGFGHAVYRTDDPRSLMLRGVARALGGDLVELATEIEKTVVSVLADLKPDARCTPTSSSTPVWSWTAAAFLARCSPRPSR